MTLNGTVHGTSIELDKATGLPDGARVVLVVRPADELPGFGSWNDDDSGLDDFLRESRDARRRDVQEPAP